MNYAFLFFSVGIVLGIEGITKLIDPSSEFMRSNPLTIFAILIFSIILQEVYIHYDEKRLAGKNEPTK